MKLRVCGVLGITFFNVSKTRAKCLQGNPVTVSDVKLYPRVIDILCRAATGIETALLRAGLRVHFGGSVIAIAVRKGVAHG